MKAIKPKFRPSYAALACAAVAALSIPASAGTCTINVGSNIQTIDGFGFASVYASTMTSAQGATFFGTGAGQLGFSLLRVHISPYGTSYDATDKANCAMAHSYGAKVLATPWSPPTSMKDNANVVGGHLLTSQYAAYAAFLKTAAANIGPDFVSVQNEPDYLPTYESCLWSGAQMDTFCANNATAIGKPVVMAESFYFNDTMTDPTLNDAAAASHITYVAGHLYGGGLAVHQNAINHGKHVWMTEHYYDGTAIGTCMSIAKEISDCMNDQFSAYFWWRAYHDTLASDDLISGSTPLKNGYTVGQFSKYIRPGNLRCSSTYNPSSNVYVTAYHGNGLVIVVVNTGSSAVSQTFTIQNATISSLYVNRTSSSENMASVSSATISSGSFTYTLPAQSVTTFHQF